MRPTITNDTGVYAIVNLVNGKRYVGSTVAGFITRKTDHWRSLKNGTHNNKHLQRSWDKHGEANFMFIILQKCPPSRCTSLETAYITKFDSANPDRGYNLSPTGGSLLGYIHTQEAKDKISAGNKGKIRSPEE